MIVYSLNKKNTINTPESIEINGVEIKKRTKSDIIYYISSEHNKTITINIKDLKIYIEGKDKIKYIYPIVSNANINEEILKEGFEKNIINKNILNNIYELKNKEKIIEININSHINRKYVEYSETHQEITIENNIHICHKDGIFYIRFPCARGIEFSHQMDAKKITESMLQNIISIYGRFDPVETYNKIKELGILSNLIKIKDKTFLSGSIQKDEKTYIICSSSDEIFYIFENKKTNIVKVVNEVVFYENNHKEIKDNKNIMINIM